MTKRELDRYAGIELIENADGSYDYRRVGGKKTLPLPNPGDLPLEQTDEFLPDGTIRPWQSEMMKDPDNPGDYRTNIYYTKKTVRDEPCFYLDKETCVLCNIDDTWCVSLGGNFVCKDCLKEALAVFDNS